MKIRFNIWLISLTAMMGLIGFAYAQSAGSNAEKMITLETGEVVPDLSGEWDVVIENYGHGWAKFQRGTFKNIIKIIQEGSMVKGVRLQAEEKRAKGSMFMQGELDKSGFKKVYYVDFSARLLPCTGQISTDGDTITIDEGFMVRATLTRK
jgi:hypothetical protein